MKNKDFVFMTNCDNCNLERLTYKIGKLQLCFSCVKEINKEMNTLIKEYKNFNKNFESKVNLKDFLGLWNSDIKKL